MATTLAPRKEYIGMRADGLKIDPRVQRDVHPAQVRKLDREWDPLLVGTLTGWRKDDGEIYLLDGQQRKTAKTGDSRHPGLVKSPDPGYVFDVEVHDGITEKDAAKIFLGLNRGRKNVDAYARWWVEMTEGNTVAIEMDKAVRAAGLEIAPMSSKHTIGCVSTLRRIMERRGATPASRHEALAWSLHTYADVWGHTPAWRSEFVEALAVLRIKNGSKIDQARLERKLLNYPSQDALFVLARRASVGSNRIMQQIIDVIVEDYNLRLGVKNKLAA